MSKTRLSPAQALDELLLTVEDRCNRAGAIINVTARPIGGEDLRLRNDSDESRLFGAALERIAAELRSLSDRAPKAGTAAE